MSLSAISSSSSTTSSKKKEKEKKTTDNDDDDDFKFPPLHKTPMSSTSSSFCLSPFSLSLESHFGMFFNS